jgi:hypothetical protein
MVCILRSAWCTPAADQLCSRRSFVDPLSNVTAFICRQYLVDLIKQLLMTTTAIRKKLVNYMKVADEKKIKALYIIVEDEISTAENDWDKGFLKEMNRRSRQFRNGTAKSFTWEETKKAAVEKVKAKRK